MCGTLHKDIIQSCYRASYSKLALCIYAYTRPMYIFGKRTYFQSIPSCRMLSSFHLLLALSVHVPHWSRIPGCRWWAGGQRRPGPSRWCGCRLRLIWSIQCSSRSPRWSRASREPLVVRHRALKHTHTHTVQNDFFMHLIGLLQIGFFHVQIFMRSIVSYQVLKMLL